MGAIGDITKLLEQLPLWKTIKELPKRVDALEKENDELKRRLEALEAEPHVADGEVCKACGKPSVRRISTKPLGGHLGALGVRNEIWRCESCGDESPRTVT